MSPYKPPLEGRSAGDYLLLDFNERTTPLPSHVQDALVGYVRGERPHRYPEYGDILEKLAAYVGVNSDQLLLTNGSDQGIEVVFRAVTEPGEEAIVPGPTFAMLKHCAELQGLKIHAPVYTDSYQYPFDEVMSALSERTRIITVCNPNSPHGTVLEKEKVIQLAEAAPGGSYPR